MAFEPGNKLRLGTKNPRVVQETIKRAILQDNGKRLREAIEQQLDQAAAGDLQALTFIRDTVEGKPTQSLQVSDNNSNLREYTMAELLAIVASQAQLGGGGVGVGQVDGGVGTAAVVVGNQPLHIDQVNSELIKSKDVPRETMDKWMDVPTL